jgi:hypothetical protein
MQHYKKYLHIVDDDLHHSCLKAVLQEPENMPAATNKAGLQQTRRVCANGGRSVGECDMERSRLLISTFDNKCHVLFSIFKVVDAHL